MLCSVVPTLCLRCTVTVHWTLVVASDSCFCPSPSLLRLLLFLCPVCSIPGRKCKKSSPMALWALYCVDGDVSGSRASEQPSYTAWLGLHSSPSSRVSPLSLFSEKGLSTPACLAVWPSVCLPACLAWTWTWTWACLVSFRPWTVSQRGREVLLLHHACITPRPLASPTVPSSDSSSVTKHRLGHCWHKLWDGG